MPYQPVETRSFGGGLNLRDGEDVTGPADAIDLLNVLFTPTGAVQQRPGYQILTAAEGTNRYDSGQAFYTTSGTRQLLVGAGNRLEAIGITGAVTASSTAPTASPHFFARVAAPGSELMYIANGTNTVRIWDGTSFSVPTYTGTTPTGKFLAVTADSRLVCARTAAQPSRVLFSDPGVPTTFGANNYVDVSPGDGEEIMGVISWRELTFVFKETKMFVFYGNSVDASGNPVFNYRPIHSNIGLVASRAVCSTPDGVYFLSRSGVYRTSGGNPELVSDKITPFFRGTTGLFFKSASASALSLSAAAMCFHDRRVYLSMTTATTENDRMLVFDTDYNWWTLYDLPAAAVFPFRVSAGNPELCFALSSGAKHLARYTDTSGLLTEAGLPIVSRWQSGWLDFGVPVAKAVREYKVWGEGQCSVGVSRDWIDQATDVPLVFSGSSGDTWGSGTSGDTWGDGTGSDLWGPSVATVATVPKLARYAVRGTVFSTRFSNSALGKTWRVHRLAHHIWGSRAPSIIDLERT